MPSLLVLRRVTFFVSRLVTVTSAPWMTRLFGSSTSPRIPPLADCAQIGNAKNERAEKDGKLFHEISDECYVTYVFVATVLASVVRRLIHRFYCCTTVNGTLCNNVVPP